MNLWRPSPLSLVPTLPKISFHPWFHARFRFIIIQIIVSRWVAWSIVFRSLIIDPIENNYKHSSINYSKHDPIPKANKIFNLGQRTHFNHTIFDQSNYENLYNGSCLLNVENQFSRIIPNRSFNKSSSRPEFNRNQRSREIEILIGSNFPWHDRAHDLNGVVDAVKSRSESATTNFARDTLFYWSTRLTYSPRFLSHLPSPDYTREMERLVREWKIFKDHHHRGGEGGGRKKK